MIKSNLVKVENKLTVCFDHDLELNSIWLADKDRDWSVYSRESFRRFWDFGIGRLYLSEETKK